MHLAPHSPSHGVQSKVAFAVSGLTIAGVLWVWADPLRYAPMSIRRWARLHATPLSTPSPAPSLPSSPTSAAAAATLSSTGTKGWLGHLSRLWSAPRRKGFTELTQVRGHEASGGGGGDGTGFRVPLDEDDGPEEDLAALARRDPLVSPGGIGGVDEDSYGYDYGPDRDAEMGLSRERQQHPSTRL